ncbi:hypothetical protein [Kitasatospora sp. DSM 101779]|uniref:hypothetical protein n=1 Tax=Kitasatospora sp. DSM 101779 TaxID=2853165 RepID=UPI0021DA2E0F|nr:hypothetical protein [Kitasatospora sp. DSM 101779]MCU7825282.1 hypothetical protein [Kitasatospora sp. DSM 101779]
MIIAWTADTIGSFNVSMIASISASRSSFSNRRTIIFVACVAPNAPTSDRPNVNGAAACAAMISAARITNCAITAILHVITITAAASNAAAINRAACAASARYPSPPVENLSNAFPNASTESPEFADRTLFAADNAR